MTDMAMFPIPLPAGRIKSRLKMPMDQKIAGVEEWINRGFSLVETRARFHHLGLIIKDDSLELSSGAVFHSRSLAQHLQGCLQVTLMAVTIGGMLEQEMEKQKHLAAVVLDAVGSECVEEAAQYVSEIIHREIKNQHCLPTKRFSPGYGDLPLGGQSHFFDILKLEELGITLTGSFYMIPQKTITAFLGWKQASPE